MNYYLIIAALLTSFTLKSQEIQVIKYPDLEKMITENSAENRVFNFWATWCAPCVKELPQFEALNNETEVLLISFDFVEQLDKVKSFIQKKGMKSKVYLLDETDYDAFINKVDPSWSGAIPATLMVNNRRSKKVFYEKSFKADELEKAYREFSN